MQWTQDIYETNVLTNVKCKSIAKAVGTDDKVHYKYNDADYNKDDDWRCDARQRARSWKLEQRMPKF